MPQLEAALDPLASIDEAREQEARRIARMIHDHVGQLATAACLAVEDLARELPARPRPALARLSRCVGALEEGLRGLARELNAGAVAEGRLGDALHGLVEGFRARLGIDIALTTDGCTGLDGRVATTVYRIVQEALTNVARHARATRVRVAVDGGSQQVRVLVRDDGVGLAQPIPPGMGLSSMRDRVRVLAGALELRSPSGGGTELSAVIPVGSLPSAATS
jgi:two-component system sensor histidine kinase UhpB